MSASFSIVIEGKGTFTASIADPEASVTVGTNTPASFTAAVAPVGPKGDTGATGPAGVVAATAPITYNSGTQTVAIDTAYFVRSPLTGATDGQILSYDEATTRPLWIDNSARTLFSTVRNETGATLTAGTVVYISGAAGNKALVTKAQANSEAASSRTFAVIAASIANNQNGSAIVAGELGKLDTTAFAEGATLYLSPTTAGAFTTTKPVAPNHIVYIATVTRVHATQGTIEVRIQNGSELDEMADVLLTSEADKDLLAYDSATSLWKNKSFSTLGLATQSYVTSQGYITSSALSGYATESFVTSQGYLTAPYNPFNQTLNTGSTVQFGEVSISGLTGLAHGINGTSVYAINTSGSPKGASLTGDGVNIIGAGKITFNDSTQQTTAYTGPQDLSAYATLASPTFTGNPIAPTPTAGDNDTSIATTAFVNTYCPAASTTTAGKVELATDAEATTGTSTALAITPASLFAARMNGSHYSSLNTFVAVASGTGTGATQVDFGCRVFTGTVSGNYALLKSGSSATYALSRGNSPGIIDFSKQVAISAVLNNTTYSANGTVRFTVGKNNTDALGNLARAGIGIRIVGTGAIELQVHNGSTLTNVTSSFTPTANQAFDCLVVSDGAGNATLYINGSSVATTTGAPTAISSSTDDFVQIEATATGTLTTQYIFSGSRIQFFQGR